MNSALLFSTGNPNSSRHTSYFLKKYQNKFTWNDTEEMLEIGCANGEVTNQVLHPFVEKNLKHLTAVDISQEAVSVANQTHSKPNLSFEWVNITAENIDEKYIDRFDHIFAFNVFHVARPIERWSCNVSKMLKRNGQFITNMIIPPNVYTKVIAEQKSDKNSPWSKYMDVPGLFVEYDSDPMEIISHHLRRNGFIINAMDMEPMTLNYPDVDSLKRTIYGANHIVKRLPQEMQADYLEDFSKKFIASMKVDKNGYFMIFNELSLLATKQCMNFKINRV